MEMETSKTSAFLDQKPPAAHFRLFFSPFLSHTQQQKKRAKMFASSEQLCELCPLAKMVA